MSESSSPTADAVYTLDAATINRRERESALSILRAVEGVTYAEPAADESALVYVGLEHGRAFDSAETPNPLASPDHTAYDPDDVRGRLLELEFEFDIRCAPTSLYMREGVVEYAIPVGAALGDDIRPPFTRQSSTTRLATRPASRELARAYLRVVARDQKVTTADAPALAADVQDAVDYLTLSEARAAIADVFGVDADELPYGNLRDAPEAVQAEYWQKLAQIADLHAEAADLIAEFDAERAADHRHTKTMEYDAYLQGVPSEWLADEE